MILQHEQAPLKSLRSTRSAFTLMEVLVVVAIIFILASVSTLVVFRYLDESKEKIAKAGVKTIDQAVTAHKTLHGNFPQSLAELTQSNDGKAAALEEEALLDPWQQPYVYEPQTLNPKTKKPLIYSKGDPANPPPGGIRNWIK
jgi:prepilin-type N-terminal cleavage/methylation domain-containing protein